ncbi:carboxypeptidase-like regulatory domain-containing protein [Winogradskyella sp. HB-48]|uniref:carboxypeptidase-like regulatory domain-containing protein n=1 Tax=Winogradskyella sp. HB-48 TaxID=3416808 RepID=UPI003CE6A0A1
MKVFFLLFPFLVFSQQQVAKGMVLDKVTNEPIPYINISILESTIGTSSDDDGSYSLNINEEDVDKNVHLSSLGYKDTTLTVTTFTNLKTIFLKPLAEQLDEVVISEKFEEKFIEINKIKTKKLRGGFAPGNKPWILALYFPYDKNYSKTEYLNQLKVYVNRGRLIKRYKSKFRIRIYKVDNNGMPGEDLLMDEIIAETFKNQKEVIVDLSQHNLTFPSDGLYVALEGLAIPFNAFDDVSTYVNTEGEKISREVVRYSPSFSATVDKKDKVKVVKFDNGKWYDFKIPLIKKDETFVPAISLTLSN